MLWLLGLVSLYTMSGLIHILLIIAVVVIFSACVSRSTHVVAATACAKVSEYKTERSANRSRAGVLHFIF